MARIETDPNYSAPTFPRATAPTDLFKKEDVQALAEAVSTHTHGVGSGLPVARIADGAIVTADIALGGQVVRPWLQGIVVPAGVATASSTFSSIPGMDLAFTASGDGYMFAWCSFAYWLSGPTTTLSWAVSIDGGGELGTFYVARTPTAGDRDHVSFIQNLGVVAAGAHTLHARWRIVGGATVTLTEATTAYMIAVEFKR